MDVTDNWLVDTVLKSSDREERERWLAQISEKGLFGTGPQGHYFKLEQKY